MTKTKGHFSGVIWVGCLAGLIGLALSFLGRGISPGRVLGDPLPLVLSAVQLTRGFLYWQWRAPLIHLLFLLLLAGLSLTGVRLWPDDRLKQKPSVMRVARITAVINVGVVALLEIDAVVVGMYYAIGGALSVWLTGWVAGWLVGKMKW